ncbi:MAG: hypothetical protein Q9187_001574 [Circinaria calcarea]
MLVFRSPTSICGSCRAQLLTFFTNGFCVTPAVEIGQNRLHVRARIPQARRVRPFHTTKRLWEGVPAAEASQGDGEDAEVAKLFSQMEAVARQARRTFGDTLPANHLSPEEYNVYERLYGPPLRETLPEDIALLQGLEEEGAVEEIETSEDALLKENEDGDLEEIHYTEGPTTYEAGKSGVNEPTARNRHKLKAQEMLHQDVAAARRSQFLEEEGLDEEDQLKTMSDETIDSDRDIIEEHKEFEDPEDFDDSYGDGETMRTHPLTAAGRFDTSPATLQLPKETFVDPITSLLASSSNKHLTEVALRTFGGPGLPNSTATPSSKRHLQQQPIALEASQFKMGEMEANVYLAAIMPGAYAAVMSSLVETRKRLGSEWINELLNKKGGPRILDAGAGGAGVLAWRQILRVEWQLQHTDALPDDSPPVPLGKATVVTGSSELRHRISQLLENTTFLPRLPDYLPARDLQASEDHECAPRKQYDIIVAPHTLWTLREDYIRKAQVQNLWSLLNPKGGVLILIEKGVPRGFELIAGARDVLLKNHISSPASTQLESELQDTSKDRFVEKEQGMIIAPCTNHAQCPMYSISGQSKGRKDHCHFSQRYIRPPYLQRILGAKDRNHEDIRFSYIAVQRGGDKRQTQNIEQGDVATEAAFSGHEYNVSDLASQNDENDRDPSQSLMMALPRAVLPPLKRRGHVILDLCTPSGRLERWTVPKSFSKQAYRDARKSKWGDLWALGAKTRVARTARAGTTKDGKSKPKRIIELGVADNEDDDRRGDRYMPKYLWTRNGVDVFVNDPAENDVPPVTPSAFPPMAPSRLAIASSAAIAIATPTEGTIIPYIHPVDPNAPLGSFENPHPYIGKREPRRHGVPATAEGPSSDIYRHDGGPAEGPSFDLYRHDGRPAEGPSSDIYRDDGRPAEGRSSDIYRDDGRPAGREVALVPEGAVVHTRASDTEQETDSRIYDTYHWPRSRLREQERDGSSNARRVARRSGPSGRPQGVIEAPRTAHPVHRATQEQSPSRLPTTDRQGYQRPSVIDETRDHDVCETTTVERHVRFRPGPDSEINSIPPSRPWIREGIDFSHIRPFGVDKENRRATHRRTAVPSSRTAPLPTTRTSPPQRTRETDPALTGLRTAPRPSDHPVMTKIHLPPRDGLPQDRANHPIQYGESPRRHSDRSSRSASRRRRLFTRELCGPNCELHAFPDNHSNNPELDADFALALAMSLEDRHAQRQEHNPHATEPENPLADAPRWPPCDICGDKPQQVKDHGTGFCYGCYGEGQAAAKVLEREGRRRTSLICFKLLEQPDEISNSHSKKNAWIIPRDWSRINVPAVLSRTSDCYMDPLSATGTVIAVIQITTKVLAICYEYRSRCKNYPQELHTIVNELRALDDSQCGGPASENTHLARVILDPNGPVRQCSDELTQLAKDLAEPTSSKKRVVAALLWPLKEKSVRKSLEAIARRKATLNLALIADQTTRTQMVEKRIGRLVTSSEATSFKEGQRRILEWLRPVDPTSNHNIACARHEPRTGDWIFHSDDYLQWSTAPNSCLWVNGFAGCGKTVMASTIIEHLKLNTAGESEHTLVFFYFDFNDPAKQSVRALVSSLLAQLGYTHPASMQNIEMLYNQYSQQQPTLGSLQSTLRSVLAQLLNVRIILDALDECNEREDLADLIINIHQWDLRHVHILFTSRRLLEFEDRLKPISTGSIDIQSALVDSDIRLVISSRLDADDRLRKWCADVDLRQEIEATLVKGAEGMFRWVTCQLDALCKCLKRERLRQTLHSLPKTLDETYDRILMSISEDYWEEARAMLQWLSLSIRPLRISDLAEVGAIAPGRPPRFDPKNRFSDQKDVLTILSPLIAVDDYNDFLWSSVRLAHFSVKEYLFSQRIRSGPAFRFALSSDAAHIDIAEGCLAYLSYFDHAPIVLSDLSIFQLLGYAALSWPFHARAVAVTAESHLLDTMIIRLLKPNSLPYLNWRRVISTQLFRDPHDSSQRHLRETEFPQTPHLPISDADLLEAQCPPLYHAVEYDLTQIINHYIEQTDNVNDFCGSHGTILGAAIHAGNSDVITRLLELGADMNTVRGNYHTALQMAAYHGHELIVKRLLEAGADVNQEGGVYHTPLQAAACFGFQSIVCLLLKHGADPNSFGGKHYSALRAAVYYGHVSICGLLLSAGADHSAYGPVRDNYPQHILSVAVAKNHKSVVDTLLNYGAGVESPVPTENSPLVWAASWGNTHNVESLLYHGASLNTACVTGLGSPLEAACDLGIREGVMHEHGWEGEDGKNLISLLLENGASVHTRDNDRPTVLQRAMKSLGPIDNIVAKDIRVITETILALVNYGASIKPGIIDDHGSLMQLAASCMNHEIAEHLGHLLADLGDEIKGDALIFAAWRGHVDLIVFLSERWPGVNLNNSVLRKSLQTAALHGHAEVVELLLSKGVDANTHSGSLGTAMQAAASRGELDTIKILLSYGSDPNIRCGIFETTLQAAAANGRNHAVRLLLDSGADARIHGGKYGSALQAAICANSEVSCYLLLEQQIDLNLIHGPCGSVLGAAAYKGDDKMVLKLLALGADINIHSVKAASPLHYAIHGRTEYYGTDTVHLLAEKGADINLAAPSGFPCGEYSKMVKGGSYPLQAAVSKGYLSAVRVLLEHGADVNAQGPPHGSALQAARQYNQLNYHKLDPGIEILLLQYGAREVDEYKDQQDYSEV